ncbi:hypothetical protein ACLKA6_001957 [Drosophila palustris]
MQRNETIDDSSDDQAMDLQSEIDALDPDNTSRAVLEETCVLARSSFMAALSAHQVSENVPSASHNSHLPKLKLPKFSGKHEEYKPFISLFKSLVDSDRSLSNIQKFNHLISCLSDGALGTVRSFRVSDEDYPKALASLERVYDKKYVIFSNTLDQLFDIEPLSKPSAIGIRSIIDSISGIFESLMSIGNEQDFANAVLVHVAMSKVDHATKSKAQGVDLHCIKVQSLFSSP